MEDPICGTRTPCLGGEGLSGREEPDRPGGAGEDGMSADTPGVWPGSPAAVWEVSGGTDVDLPRPAPPPWRSSEDFSHQVRIPRRHVYSALTITFLALVLGRAGAVFLDADFPEGVSWQFVLASGPVVTAAPWIGYALLVLALGALARAATVFGRGERNRSSEMRSCHEQAVRSGFVAHMYRTPFRAQTNDGYVPVALFIDSRIPDDRARRTYTASLTWLRLLSQDSSAGDEVRRRLGHRDFIPVTDFFGPESAGAWLVRAVVGPDASWQLVIPDTGSTDSPTRFTHYAIRARGTSG
jgi:hypothetical protein